MADNQTKSRFVHLHTHTHYSLLDGMSKIPALLDRVVELGMDACAITDHGVLYGAIEFYQEAKKRGIKPIVGMEAYVAPRKLTDKTSKIDSSPYHLVLLAKNETGYKNLIKLTTIGHLDGYYYRPRVDKETLARHSEGLIALSACMGGEVARQLLADNFLAAKKTALEHAEIFGPDHYYLEVQDHPGWKESDELNKKVVKLAEATKLPLVVTRDSHYIYPTDLEAHDVLLCIQTGRTITEQARMRMEMELSLTSAEETVERWRHLPEAISNTVKIADLCNLELNLGQIHIPTFPLPKGTSKRDYLRELCRKGLIARYGRAVAGTAEEQTLETVPRQYRDRMEYELTTIEKMGYESYFLIIHDFIAWAKGQGIVVGPGRGSAAGSIVSYCLGITDIDPMKYDLLFERFLNPDRITMPDIDIDFADNRRDEVINYVAAKYGHDRVAQIITFGTMMARNAIRDTGRALGASYGQMDRLAKMVTPPAQGKHNPLAKQIKENTELKAEYETNPDSRRVIDLAMNLEGVVRHSSTHAAGVVISEEPLTEFAPLQKPTRGGVSILQTQYSMNPIEEVGLLKMDFLGLSNLTIIEMALTNIKRNRGETLNLSGIPLDDASTFGLLSRGETIGVFQLESAGMRRYLKKLEPTVLDDIIAMVALYRPGPMQWLDSYIARKHGREEVTHRHSRMKPALESTYGIIVYQEQVMKISEDFAGFSGPQADTLRYATGKKKPEILAKMKREFIEGAMKTSGVSAEEVSKLWRELEDFAFYSFNKSHAACYALIAYQTAYLKAHWPAEFMAALLTSNYADVDRVGIDIAECRRMGIEVLPPDVNESDHDFTVLSGGAAIRFGLSAIKNIGEGVIAATRAAREAGHFVGIEDFVRRVDAAELNKKMLESLAKSGALDTLEDRGKLLANLDVLLDYGAAMHKAARSGQIAMFEQGVSAPHLNLVTPPAPIDTLEKLSWEKELLGVYVSEHPLDRFASYLAANTRKIKTITAEDDGKRIKVGGIVSGARKILTKRQEPMLFVRLEDLTGSVEIIVFPSVLKDKGEVWAVDKVISVAGRVSRDLKDEAGELKIIAALAETITPKMALSASETMAESTDASQLKIDFGEAGSREAVTEIKNLLLASEGKTPVLVLLTESGKRRVVKLPFTVAPTAELLAKIEKRLGKGSVVIN